MTEESMFWANGVGDGGPYSQDQLRLLYDALAGAEDADRGVLVTQGNELDPSSTGNNNIRLATGRAVVDGTLYENDAILDIVTASPAIGTTGRRCVLQKDWAARTVRAAIITSADGVGAIPALTQNDGTIWEIPICSFTITTGGVIGALTDQRQFCEGTDSRSITILGRDLAQSENVNNGGAFGHPTLAIPARTLGTTGGLRLTMSGDYLNNTGVDRDLTLESLLGAVTVLSTGNMVIPASANRRDWRLVVEMMNSAAGAQKWSASLEISQADANTFPVTDPTATTDARGTGYAASAEDTTVAQTIRIQTQHSVADPLLSFRQEMAILERIPPA